MCPMERQIKLMTIHDAAFHPQLTAISKLEIQCIKTQLRSLFEKRRICLVHRNSAVQNLIGCCRSINRQGIYILASSMQSNICRKFARNAWQDIRQRCSVQCICFQMRIVYGILRIEFSLALDLPAKNICLQALDGNAFIFIAYLCLSILEGISIQIARRRPEAALQLRILHRTMYCSGKGCSTMIRTAFEYFPRIKSLRFHNKIQIRRPRIPAHLAMYSSLLPFCFAMHEKHGILITEVHHAGNILNFRPQNIHPAIAEFRLSIQRDIIPLSDCRKLQFMYRRIFELHIFRQSSLWQKAQIIR